MYILQGDINISTVMWLTLTRYLLLVSQEQKPGEVAIFLWKLKTSVLWCGQSACFHPLWVWQYHSLTSVHQGAVYSDKCLTLQEVWSVSPTHPEEREEKTLEISRPHRFIPKSSSKLWARHVLTLTPHRLWICWEGDIGTLVFSRSSVISTQAIWRCSCPPLGDKAPSLTSYALWTRGGFSHPGPPTQDLGRGSNSRNN